MYFYELRVGYLDRVNRRFRDETELFSDLLCVAFILPFAPTARTNTECNLKEPTHFFDLVVDGRSILIPTPGCLWLSFQHDLST
jgi:hypothetical protein